MKIAGIIAEYNPFHSGHAYHIRKTREITRCDYVIICMGGSFTQRGEPARIDKAARVQAALRCGADAVFELPALFAVRTADAFARGGAGVLGGMGCDVLSFGCETEDMHLLHRIADLRDLEPADFSAQVRSNLSAGMSHARAWGEAAAETLNLSPDALNAPNMILAIEYIRAIRAGGYAMQPCAILRQGDYHSDDASKGYASAGAIRKMMETDVTAAAMHVPEGARDAIYASPDMHPMDDLLLYALRGMPDSEIAALIDVDEGLEMRIKRCADACASRSALIEAVKCKRYTYARLSRLCAHALLHMTKSLANRHPRPEYARLLGMRRDAAPLMKDLKARAAQLQKPHPERAISIVSDAQALRGNEIFDLECRATDLRALLQSDPEKRRAGQEYTQKFILE